MPSYEEAMAARDARKAKLKEEKEIKRQKEMLALDRLEQEHGDDNVSPVWTQCGLVVVRRPKKAEIDRYQEAVLRDGKPQHKAQRLRLSTEQLARCCVIYPEKQVYDLMCEEFGGIPTSVGAECARLANVIYEEESEK